MEIYLVGGAVRDELLGLEVRERDWVVVGATPAQMLALGYRQVGRDFPVFLHPETREEYALARSERKTAPGYRGFEVDADPGISLEEDLKRRDLSINAMARDAAGRLIDPYHGLADLRAGILRHVSPAFSEDPVRLLRIARFAARFAHLGFHIAPETMQLLRQMVTDGEVNHLVAERVWQEIIKALAESSPARFFEVLCECNAMAAIVPELEVLCIQGDSLQRLARIARQYPEPKLGFASLCLDLELEQIHSIGQRLPIPKDFQQLALAARTQAPILRGSEQLDTEDIMAFFEAIDALRRPERLEDLLKLYRTLFWSKTRSPELQLRTALKTALAVKVGDLPSGLKGPAIAKALREARVQAISAMHA
jgi:tRNA nucleotidyltransferase (CCA-adding enzyme)